MADGAGSALPVRGAARRWWLPAAGWPHLGTAAARHGANGGWRTSRAESRRPVAVRLRTTGRIACAGDRLAQTLRAAFAANAICIVVARRRRALAALGRARRVAE